MKFSPLIEQLMEALRVLPGVGPKTAQRMAFYLLERDREGGLYLCETLKRAMLEVNHCRECRILCESELCGICSNGMRDLHQLCIVESPQDVFAIEQTRVYRGFYFVLMGHLSPIDGIGAKELGLDLLEKKLQTTLLKEVILATNPTVEGEATAYYISELLKPYPIHVTRIAHGVPVGGELEYVDGGTLIRAFNGRLSFQEESL